MTGSSIAWWGWLAIWGGVGLALVAMLALCAWWLFRKFLTLADDLGDLAETAEPLTPDDAAPERPALAVLAPYREVVAARQVQRLRANERSRIRHEKRIARARRITGVDATSIRWPDGWY